MIDALGTVTGLDGQYALVRMDETGCGRCYEQGGCGGNNLGRVFCSAPRSFRVLNPGGSLLGDRVTVVIAEGAVQRSAALAYGMPLLMLFVGALLGSRVAGEIGSMIGALLGIALGWAIARIKMNRLNTTQDATGYVDERFQPYIRY